MTYLTAQGLSTLFNCLHDVGFESYSTHSPTRITLRIDCLYLAESINPSFSFFRLEVLGLTHLSFLPWEDHDGEAQVITEPERIFVGDLEIRLVPE